MEKKVSIIKLFQEKKYSEVIFLIDNKVPENQKNSSVLNLLGVSRILKGKLNKEDFLLAIDNFKTATLKEHQTKNSLEAFKNFINISVELYDFDKSTENHKKVLKFFKEILNIYNQNKDFFSKDEFFLLSLIRVHVRLNDLDKVRENYEELIKNKFYRPETICDLIYNNLFVKNWKQEDFLKYGRLLNSNIKVYENEKLSPIHKVKNKKIKIGFLSSDIKSKHSVIYFLKTVIDNYNKDKFEIYLFSNNLKSSEDETIRSIKNSINKNYDIYGMNDIETINLIRDNKIDILIDLMGLTSDQKIKILKNRAAPIQIVWCGFCNTTGIDEVDYIISDPNLIYNSEIDLYQEKIIFMPKIWNCHTGLQIKKIFNESPLLKNNMVTFGSFNNFGKINTSVVETWSRILKKVKNSKLILKSSRPRVTEILSEKFKNQGVLNSVEFITTLTNFEDHMHLYKKIDIALDTFPYNGVTTSFEAIWMGVPVITMKGYNFHSRCGESINKNLNMKCLIAENEIDYVAKATELSDNKEKLLDIRKKIFDQATSSPLFDTKSFSNDFFKSLATVYNKYLQDLK
jgi:predicted O-linked N-acetylglucosamine transferase (SPINDLY family)